MSAPAADTLGVGIVGLSAAGGWASRAHVSALAAVDGLELRGLAASSEASAQAAAEKHSVALAFGSVEQLAAAEQIDLVVIAVRVPAHRELVLGALPAGKAVLCEWPLARNVAEAQELVAAAAGVRSFVGLQARAAPSFNYLRDLIAEGYVGEVLSTSVIASGIQWGAEVLPGAAYLLDRDNGASMLMIPFGHTIDAFTMVLGEFSELVATTATRRGEVHSGSGEPLPMTAEDQIALSGTLAGGAVASVHYRGGESPGTNFLWEIDGTAGTLVMKGYSGHLQSRAFTIEGARGAEALAELPIPDAYDLYPALAGGLGHALAHAYRNILLDLREGTQRAPDFAHALHRHRMLAAIQQAAATGARQSLAG